MPDSQTHLDSIAQYSARNYNPLPIVLSRGQGTWVEDVEGKRYLDCLSAYSALNHGHCHPRLVDVLVRQASRLTLTSRAFHHDQFGPFCRELAEFSGMESVLPMNSGVEAVETAVKAARRWGYRKKNIAPDRARIIVCENNFHGRTVGAVSFSTDADYREGFGPFTPGFSSVPYGDAEALEKAIDSDTAAFLVEPIQGEAGIILPPEGYLKHARQICREREVLFIADEIQTGLCRTGHRLACDREGVQADVLVLGKALGGGILPVSAVAARWDVMEVFDPGSHGSTFGGNPLACAVAREALRVLVEENLAKRARELGDHALQTLRSIDSPLVRQVRGAGLLIGIELLPEAGGARAFCERLLERGVLCWETHRHVIRVAPPLVIDPDDLNLALDHIRQVLL